MKFELTESEQKEYLKWARENPSDDVGTIGGATKFIFTLTSMGNAVRAERICGGETIGIDLTDYDSW